MNKNIHIHPNENSQTLSDMRENQLHHSPYAVIQRLFKYVKTGDVEGVRNFQQELDGQTLYLGSMSKDPLMQAKYMAATTASTLTYIGVENSFPDEYAYSIADLFIQEIDKMTDPDCILVRLHEHVLYFTELMRQKLSTRNPYVLRCVNYICVNLHHEITVEELAELCGLSKNRVYALFKQELGMTVGEYVMAERLREAKHLLSYGRYERISQVAYLLNFCSQSYFSKCFKQQYGCSPGQFFRRAVRNAGA